jgi:hypothetical protein
MLSFQTFLPTFSYTLFFNNPLAPFSKGERKGCSKEIRVIEKVDKKK